MIANNLIACSSLSNTRINEFNFSCQFNESVIIPKCVSLSKATVTNTLMTFRPSQLTLYMSFNSSVIEAFQVPNTYYDTMTELLAGLNSITTLTTLGIVFSFDTESEVLVIKMTPSITYQFTLYGMNYLGDSNICKRLGFSLNRNYKSTLVGGQYQAILSTAPPKLLRTTGFFVCSDLQSVQSACPASVANIVDFIPIQSSNLAYGDLIVLDRDNISRNFPNYSEQQKHAMNSNSCFNFQLLDDEFFSINDPDKGTNTILIFNCDYE
jgi:hypothetical protein